MVQNYKLVVLGEGGVGKSGVFSVQHVCIHVVGVVTIICTA